MSERWLSMQHRDFWDVPRMFVVEYEGGTYLFDCPFSQDLDDYPDEYTVYRLRAPVPAPGESWLELAQGAEIVGQIAVREVEFDPTRRRALAAKSLKRVLNRD